MIRRFIPLSDVLRRSYDDNVNLMIKPGMGIPDGFYKGLIIMSSKLSYGSTSRDLTKKAGVLNAFQVFIFIIRSPVGEHCLIHCIIMDFAKVT